MANDSTSITFSIYYAGKLVREVTFDRPIINVGKLSTSNLRLDDVNVSRKHSVIERRENGEWRVTDLGSTNGTAVNGRRVTQTPLHDGDRILIGNTTLVVHLDEASVAAGAAGAEAGAGPEPVEEIQGLGETSFYTAEGEDKDGAGMALEVALLWGETVLSIEDFQKPQRILVGEVSGCRFTIPEEALGVTSFPLLEARRGSFALNLSNPAIQGDVLIDGSIVPIGELGKDGRLEGDFLVIDKPMRARLRAGEFVLLVSYGRMPPKVAASPLGSIDYTPHIYVALSAILHIAFLVFLSLMPEEQLRSTMDPTARRQRLIEVIKVVDQEEEEEEEKKEPEEDPDAKKDPNAPEDALAVSDTVVEQPTDQEESLLNKLAKKQQEKRPDAWQSLSDEEKKQKAQQMAATAGAAKVLNDSNLLENLLTSNPSLAPGANLMQLTSRGDGPGDVMAGGGAIDPFGGTLGSGASGGFAGSSSVGGGGPEGGIPGGGVVAGLRKGGTDLDNIRLKEREMVPVAIASDARVSGKLDRATVQAIIRRNLSGIKWCYQDALQRQPDLRGKVTLAFTILPTGRVQNPAARDASFSDQVLLNCITRKMSRWKFPSPKDGGIVQVTYPLLLKTR